MGAHARDRKPGLRGCDREYIEVVHGKHAAPR